MAGAEETPGWAWRIAQGAPPQAQPGACAVQKVQSYWPGAKPCRRIQSQHERREDCNHTNNLRLNSL